MTNKITKGKQTFIYPMATVLLGTKIDDKPNFMTLGWITRVNANPPLLGISINKAHLSANSILTSKCLSINVPSSDLLENTDYCGIVSGKNDDKSKLFNVFYGKTNAPMIQECKLNFECSIYQTIELPTNYLFICEIIETYCNETCISDGIIDPEKIDPILLTMPDNNYWNLGNKIGKAWNYKATKHE